MIIWTFVYILIGMWFWFWIFEHLYSLHVVLKCLYLYTIQCAVHKPLKWTGAPQQQLVNESNIYPKCFLCRGFCLCDAAFDILLWALISAWLLLLDQMKWSWKKVVLWWEGRGTQNMMQSSWSTLRSALRQVTTGPFFIVCAATTRSRRS